MIPKLSASKKHLFSHDFYELGIGEQRKWLALAQGFLLMLAKMLAEGLTGPGGSVSKLTHVVM